MQGILAVSKANLIRDKNVLGQAWLKTYRGYFSNKKNIELFVQKILPYAPKKKHLSILYPCSTSGLIGEKLVEALNDQEILAELVLVDIPEEHLKENKNPETIKIMADITKLDIGRLFDVIIMRSSLDYFPSKKLQIKALSNLGKHLAKDGIFFNQAASMPSMTERDLADRIYKSNRKIGHRHFQCRGDIGTLYKKGGFQKIREIGAGLPLILTEKEHINRYKINETQIKKIQKIIQKIPEKKRPNIETTKTGYKLKFVFPIYAAWKAQKQYV